MQLQSRVREQERMETKHLFQMQSARNPKICWGVSSQIFKNFTLKGQNEQVIWDKLSANSLKI